MSPPPLDIDSISPQQASFKPRQPTWMEYRLRGWVVPATLAAADILAYPIAFAAFSLLGWSGIEPALTAFVVAIVAVITLVQFAAAGFYPGYVLHRHEHLRRRTLIVLVATGIGACTVALLAPGPTEVGQTVALLLLAAGLQPLFRLLAMRRLHSRGLFGFKVVVLGDPDLARRLTEYLHANWQLGLIPGTSADGMAMPAVLAGPMPTRSQIQQLLQHHGKIIVLADLPGLAVSGLQPAGIGGRIGIVLEDGSAKVGMPSLRRVFDLALALPMTLVALPIIGVAALAIRSVDRGPVFYRQNRCGQHGETLQVIKLRTMYQDAERRLEDLLATDADIRAEWQSHFKLKNDPRILPGIGAVLRSTSCDELPQLFNVILGQMSLVGPRPFPDYHLAAVPPDFRAKRRSVTPGITGLWQVSERSAADLERQQFLDEFYIDNRSLWLDLDILIRTVGAVLGRSGAY
ncbi:MAG: sugar transferase [Paracoccaceae bacterium]